MDAFIWQKVEEKTQRLGSIWTRTDSNVSDMQSELSPEEIKYSLVENPQEKLKIKLDSEFKKAEYDLKLATENLETLDKINDEIRDLRSSIDETSKVYSKHYPLWLNILDTIKNKIIPFVDK